MSGFSKGPFGFCIDLENGWTVSVQFGIGSYCSNRSNTGNPFKDIPEFVESPNAEIAAWRTATRGENMSVHNSVWYKFKDGEEVKGWQSPTEVLQFMNMVNSFPILKEREEVDA